MIVYGTRIHSDIPFPLNIPNDQTIRPEITLSQAPPTGLMSEITCGFPLYQSHGRKVYLYSDRIFEKNTDKQPWCYEVKDVLRFYWYAGDSTIYYRLDKKGDASLLSFWFIHLLLPLYFTLEKRFDFFHAGAVRVEDKNILFLAPSMGGKSTMTDFFLKQGHSLIADDKVATFSAKNQFMTVASHPYHRPYRKFEDLGTRVQHYENICEPIHALYSLQKSPASSKPLISEVSGVDKFKTILPNYLYMFPYLMAYRLQYLSKVLHSIKMFHIQIPWDQKQLGSVHDSICQHCRIL